MRKVFSGLQIIIVILLVFSLTANAGTALDSIKEKITGILEVLRDEGLKGESKKEMREKKIWELIDSAFDYTELSKRTLSKNWKKLNTQQQKAFTDLFSRLLGSIYLKTISKYTDEKVVFNKEKKISESKVEVQSRVITASKEIPVNYKMIMKQGEWKVYDVVIEGVSMTKNYRSQFRKILKNKSPDDMINMLRKKVG